MDVTTSAIYDVKLPLEMKEADTEGNFACASIHSIGMSIWFTMFLQPNFLTKMGVITHVSAISDNRVEDNLIHANGCHCCTLGGIPQEYIVGGVFAHAHLGQCPTDPVPMIL